MKKVYVVVVDYHGGKDLKKCLASLKKAITPTGWSKEVLEVDNNKFNRGFAKAANIGIKKAAEKGAQAVLLLNQDTVVEKDFLISLLNNKADIVGPVIHFSRNAQDVYDYGGKIDCLWGRTKHIELPNFPIVQFYNLDYVSGCSMLIKMPVIEKIGLLDERYFLYFEDADYCLRAKKAGFKIAVDQKSIITHNLKDPKNRPIRQLLKSNLIFINRWVPIIRRPSAYLYWLGLCIKILFLS
jgi:GT2 family glycosyltransferase